MTFQKYGESAILVNFDQKIDEQTHQQVVALEAMLNAAKFDFIRFTIPAYCSLTIGYDASNMDYATLCLLLEKMQKKAVAKVSNYKIRKITLPVCYEEEFALDIKSLSDTKKMTPKEIVQLHSTQTYRVYMLGFLPGFAYLGKVVEPLVCGRKQEPRLKTPALSVGIAGWQTGIYPLDAPGGWQILGRTPIPVFNIDQTTPFLFQVGDRVSFQVIDKSDYFRIQKDISNKSFNWHNLYG